MQLNDLVNGAFELFGAVCTWGNVFKYRKDREVKGIYWPITIFFAGWGLWNLYYYSSLNQPLSFYAGTVLCLGNLAWLALVIKDRNNNVNR